MEKRLMAVQPFSAAKRVAAAVTAFATLGGAAAIAGHNIKKNMNAEEMSHISDQSLVLEVSSDAEITNELYLDFDINDPVAVEKRAKQIYNLCSEERTKEISVKDIINLIYILNGKYEMIDFGTAKDDEKKFELLQKLTVKMEMLLGNNVPGYNGLLVGNQKTASGDLVYSAYLLSENSDGKKLAIEFADIVEEQKNNIKAGASKEVMIKTAEKYVDVVERIIKVAKNKKLSVGEAAIITFDIKGKNPLFTTVLSMDNAKYSKIIDWLDKNYTTFTNNLLFYVVEGTGIVVDSIDCESSTVALGNSYNSADAAHANSMDAAEGGVKKEEVDAGGAHVGTEQVASGGETLGTQTREEVATVAGESHSESTSYGGEVVDEKVVESIVQIAEMHTQIIELGGEKVEEEVTFVDADANDYNISVKTK